MANRIEFSSRINLFCFYQESNGYRLLNRLMGQILYLFQDLKLRVTLDCFQLEEGRSDDLSAPYLGNYNIHLL